MFGLLYGLPACMVNKLSIFIGKGTCLSLWLLLRSAGEGANALLSGRYGMGGSIERCVLCRGESVTFESQTTVVAIQHVVTIYRPPWGG